MRLCIPGTPGYLVFWNLPLWHGASWDIPGYLVFWDRHVATMHVPLWRDILGYPRNPGILSILGSACSYMYPYGGTSLDIPGIPGYLVFWDLHVATPMAWDILGYPRNPGILSILGSTCSYTPMAWYILGYPRNPRDT